MMMILTFYFFYYFSHFDVFPHPRTRVTIRRNSVFEDGFSYLNELGSRLKSPVAIQFIDEFGMPEAGIDGGGLFKEFLTSYVNH
jgi:ubiquitin-protein ligase E3 C